ncbi:MULTISPECIES: hypothetical protein [unclassified Marinobacter]|jgi:hypothetical protein|uniref:hypothetical protein n=1 Tax=unclassified Marinobacter TaxID=83889 RepID=UPI00200C1E50|nr:MULTISPECIES: hypothetical protein [unclassified Marinobacter]MCL1483659.1 hypothetical protein [Marinobacter sp.]UQG56693.1 hypothetical protein MIH16_03200 [Marinobacter sp. M4C]UQG65497.1 hypothetical protein MIH17_03200 [Marinobacter sp. M2C]UQG69777.1 hypothetical protein MIH19_03195 [Marinobacter sp. M1C]
MAQDPRARATGKAGNGRFLAIPHSVLNSDAYRGLKGWGVRLLVDIAGQYNGKNNGDLCAAMTVMEPRGWKSNSSLGTALSALLAAGLIEQTRQGGRNRCSLYAVTWHSIDDCGGKLDVRPTKAPSARYLNLAAMLKTH